MGFGCEDFLCVGKYASVSATHCQHLGTKGSINTYITYRILVQVYCGCYSLIQSGHRNRNTA